MKKIVFLFVLALGFSACSENGEKSDAYGNFEAIETIVAAQGNGKILQFEIKEGDHLKAGQSVALIDTTQLALKKQQVQAQKKAISSKVDNILAQIAVLEKQKDNLLVEKQRIEKLLKDGAATRQKLDNITGQIEVVEKQIRSVKTQNSGVLNEIEALDKQIEQIDDQIDKCTIKNPVNGVVLEKYAEAHEITTMGKPLYKIADLSEMILRVYVSGSLLPKVKIGQQANVLIDKNQTENSELSGTVRWISAEAEFTPKIIQTKEERVDLVYAVKVYVKNDGSLKIGMPGEVNF